MTKISRLILRRFSHIRSYLNSFKKHEVENAVETFRDVAGITYAIAIPFLTIIAFGCLIYDIGYTDFYTQKVWFYSFWGWCYFFLAIVLLLRFVLTFSDLSNWRARVFNGLIILLIFYLQYILRSILQLSDGFFSLKLTLYVGSIFLFIVEGSNVLKGIYQRKINPALLFVGSFFLVIMAGAFLLMLPNATTRGITPIDAWFTSASAVCVTGLIVVDTATAFTTFGKFIILILIQIGGLGIMTFAGLLAYLSVGSVSFANQIALKDMLSSDRVGNVIGVVTRVIIVTITFEAIGAALIYSTLDDTFLASKSDRLIFSVFHSISAFCNAGFSTLTNGLYEFPVRFNYSLQMTIAALIVLGGMGFPIVFNLYLLIRTRITNIVRRLLKIPPKEHVAHILHTSSRLALTTSLILLTSGFIAYSILENNASLQQHPTLIGKIATSFFGAVTPRTAGFNTVDLTLLTLPTVMVYLLLMYIGASPGSTGGGIKTTVAAVAFLNMKTIILGKSRTEVFRTQISNESTNRAFAIILSSLLILGLTVLLISFNDSDKGLLKIAFESFSAFSTVGLSLGITADLSAFSKLVLSLVMLIGRVGTLTMLIAFVTPNKEKYYRYPTEDVLL